jgi:hypothetical protein
MHDHDLTFMRCYFLFLLLLLTKDYMDTFGFVRLQEGKESTTS